MKKKLLILGGSRPSIEIVKQAHKMGIETYVTDFYPIDKSPAKIVADHGLVVDTTDKFAIKKEIDNNNIDGVITGFTDSTLPYYVEICEYAGLPCYANANQVTQLNNKANYKALLKDYDIKIPEEIDVEEKNIELMDKFPFLIKPVDSSGGRGVYVCNNMEDMNNKIERSLKFSESNKVLIEKYYDCEEITAFFFFDQGEIILTSVADRIVQSIEGSTIKLPTGYIFHSKYYEAFKTNVFPKIEKLFKSLNIQNGMLFAQCLVDGNDFRIYDIGYRLTGSLEYIVFEQMFDFNPLEELIYFSTSGQYKTENIVEKIENPMFKYGINLTVLLRPGKIKEIKGVNTLKNHKDIQQVFLNYEVGQTVEQSAVGTLKQIGIRIFFVGNDKDYVNNLISYCEETVDVLDEQGESMVISNYFKLNESR